MNGPSPQALSELSQLQRTMRPPELTRDVFPPDLDVIDFDPSGKIRIRTSASGQNTVAILFSSVFFPSIGASFGGALGLLLGITLWVWRSRLGIYVSVNLNRRSYALVTPGSAEWTSGAPDVEVRASRNGDQWKTTLVIGGLQVIERLTPNSGVHPDLERFANALNARLGRPVQVEIADGVYISATRQ